MYYSAIKKNEILPYTTTWMELDSIILSEISQSEKDKYHMIHVEFMWNLRNKTNEQRKKKRERQTKKQILHHGEKTDGYQRRGGWGVVVEWVK